MIKKNEKISKNKKINLQNQLKLQVSMANLSTNEYSLKLPKIETTVSHRKAVDKYMRFNTESDIWNDFISINI